MAYTRTHWINQVKLGDVVLQAGTPVDQAHMNNLEDGVEEAKASSNSKLDKIPAGSFTTGNIVKLTNSGGIQDGGLAFSVVDGILNITY